MNLKFNVRTSIFAFSHNQLSQHKYYKIYHTWENDERVASNHQL